MNRNVTPQDDVRRDERESYEPETPPMFMNTLEISSALFQIQHQLPVILAMPLRQLAATFESVAHIVALKENSKDWAESLRGLKRNQEIVLCLKYTQDCLKDIFARYK